MWVKDLNITNNSNIDLSGLNSGLYFIEIKNEKNIILGKKKIVVK